MICSEQGFTDQSSGIQQILLPISLGIIIIIILNEHEKTLFFKSPRWDSAKVCVQYKPSYK